MEAEKGWVIYEREESWEETQLRVLAPRLEVTHSYCSIDEIVARVYLEPGTIKMLATQVMQSKNHSHKWASPYHGTLLAKFSILQSQGNECLKNPEKNRLCFFIVLFFIFHLYVKSYGICLSLSD